MGYDDTDRTARLDRFSHIALKLTLGLQNICSFFRFALFDGEIYTLEPNSKGLTDTSLVVISVIKCSYLFMIFVSNGTVSSKKSIFSFVLSIITGSGFSFSCH